MLFTKKGDALLLKTVISIFSILYSFPKFKGIKIHVLVPCHIFGIISSCLVLANTVKGLNIGYVILPIMTTIPKMAMVLCCLRDFYRHVDQHTELFELIEIFDFGTKQWKADFEIAAAKYYLKFGLTNCLQLIAYILMIFFQYIGEFNFLNLFGYIYFFIMKAQIMMICLITIDLLKIFYKRYDAIKTFIKKTHCPRKSRQPYLEGLYIKGFYLLLHRILDKANILLGQKLLLIILMACLNTLNVFHYAITITQSEVTHRIFTITATIETIFHWVRILYYFIT